MLVYSIRIIVRCFVDFLGGKFSSTICLKVKSYNVVVYGVDLCLKHHKTNIYVYVRKVFLH